MVTITMAIKVGNKDKCSQVTKVKPVWMVTVATIDKKGDNISDNNEGSKVTIDQQQK